MVYLRYHTCKYIYIYVNISIYLYINIYIYVYIYIYNCIYGIPSTPAIHLPYLPPPVSPCAPAAAAAAAASPGRWPSPAAASPRRGPPGTAPRLGTRAGSWWLVGEKPMENPMFNGKPVENHRKMVV